ncbi:MFS transporter [Salibacterium halotolerans]|uniref:MFS transporter, SP family, inositol transporter n=1 Tax=Salibacterium halotolerans TaxID=1884432 RepID=A0A1I5KZE4_9BACI|nr:MFS transporter [Salibacterium halotolerans]SFO90454.1 MFS transporter, SP family, inositol transporter [Salibacterium halotolerans]
MKIGKKSTTGWRATIAVAMANYIEAGSIIAAASSLTLWEAYLGLDNTAVGLLSALSANAFGAAIGALIGGPLSDKLGRKFIYTYDLLVYMLGVLLVAGSVNFTMLLAGTVITGIAVGAGVPAAWTYIAEQAPDKERAKHVGTAQLAWSMGPMITFLLAVAVAPLELMGSRLIFLHLFVVALITWYVRQGLPESDLWKEDRDTKNKTKNSTPISKGMLVELFTIKANRQALFLLVGIYLFWNLTSGAMGYFMPYIFENVGGLSNESANLLQAVLWFFTVVLTYFGFMLLGDKMSRRLLFSIGAVAGIAAWVMLTFAGMSWPVLITFVILWGGSAGIGAQAFYGLWAAELFPTRYRASAQGLMFFIVRSGIAIWSFVLPTVMATLGFQAAGIVMIIFLVIHLIIGVALAPNTLGKSLSTIEEERFGEVISEDKVKEQ